LTRPPLDPESFEAAKAATNLSCASINLINANGPESADIEEAKLLAREGVRTIKEIKGFDSPDYRWCFDNLLKVLFFKKDYGKESQSLLEDNLSDAIRHQGMDGKITYRANDYLRRFYF
jgi:hypothetical protein